MKQLRYIHISADALNFIEQHVGNNTARHLVVAAVYAAIAGYGNRQYMRGLKGLCEDTLLTRKAVSRAIADLVSMKLVSVEVVGRKSLYRAHPEVLGSTDPMGSTGTINVSDRPISHYNDIEYNLDYIFSHTTCADNNNEKKVVRDGCQVLPISDLSNEMLEEVENGAIWALNLQRMYKCTTDDIKRAQGAFLEVLRGRGVEVKTRADYRQHFANWFGKQCSTPSTPTKSTKSLPQRLQVAKHRGDAREGW